MKIGNKYDIFIFDLDGTLVQSNTIKYETFFTVTSNFKNSRKILRYIIDSNSDLTRNEIFDRFVLDLPLKIREDGLAKKLTQEYSLKCEEKIKSAPEVKCAKFFLEKLKKLKKSIFLSSATPTFYLKKLVRLRGLDNYFNRIYGAPQTKSNHIKQILKNISKVNRAVYIGDSEIDRLAAEKNGCNFIGIGGDATRFKFKPMVLVKDYKNFIYE